VEPVPGLDLAQFAGSAPRSAAPRCRCPPRTRCAPTRRPGVADAGAAPGYPGEEELLGRYQQDSGRDLSDLGFYIALACFKLAVILEGIHYRHLHGQTVGAGYEHVGALAEPLAEAGLTALKEHI
jgi:aminoglycoside phosphotransferase (APT) family kinase protein